MAIVDAYDALTTVRCYRAPLAHERAVELIVEGEGTRFDPPRGCLRTSSCHVHPINDEAGSPAPASCDREP